MVKARLKEISNSLKIRGCFFCFRNKVILVTSFVLFLLLTPQSAFPRQVIEFNTVTGLWDYVTNDTVPPIFPRQIIEYNTITGLWDYTPRSIVNFPAGFSPEELKNYFPAGKHSFSVEDLTIHNKSSIPANILQPAQQLF